MKKLLLLVHLTVGLTSLVTAQTPKKIHDLKSLTDSSGTVHLFYRIYAEYEGTDYFTDNIYHYNTQTGQEVLFLEHYYDTHLGFEYQSYVNEYRFYDQNLEKYILRGSFGFEFGYIERSDSLVFEGFGIFVEKIKLSKADPSIVYAKFSPGGYIKSLDGGITWPEEEKLRNDNVADSLKLDFPLVSMSPYDNELMFGASTNFFQSPDAGQTRDTIEIYPNDEKIFYDSDTSHVYAMNYFVSVDNCSPDECEHAFYKSSFKGQSGSWKKKKIFFGEKQIYVHPENSGELYIWGKDTVYVSKNYGESFDFLYEIEEAITGFVVEGGQVFITTISSLYELENDKLSLLHEIPVGVEENDPEIPSEITLHQNYPNPFNPSTVIRFELYQPAQVSLKIYDVVGNLVQTLISEGTYPAGEHRYTWNAGSYISSGVYFYKLQTSKETITKKMILIK